jgi:hypothetical protein
MIVLPLIAATLALSACDEGCDLAAYTGMRVALVSAAAAPAAFAAGTCVVYTDMPVDTKNPDAFGDKLVHIGQSVHQCLTGSVAVTLADEPAAFYSETLWFRIAGSCPGNFYGCFVIQCRTVDVDLASGKAAPCPVGVPMAAWSPECWQHFYAVLGHEVMHGWLGAFHA